VDRLPGAASCMSLISVSHSTIDVEVAPRAQGLKNTLDVHLLAVADSWKVASKHPPKIKIYRVASSLENVEAHKSSVGLDYQLYHTLESTEGIYASALAQVVFQGHIFLAVSCFSDNENSPQPASSASLVYRYIAGARGDEQSPRSVARLEKLQNIPSNAASDVVFWETPKKELLLMLSNFIGNDGSLDGDVRVFLFDRSTSSFGLIQKINARAANDVEVFRLEGLGTFLAIANRKTKPSISENDAASYAAASQIYRWLPSPGQDELAEENSEGSRVPAMTGPGLWVLFQELGAELESVVSSRADPTSEELFCDPCPPVSDDGRTIPVPFLRGATSLTHFTDHGEHYLAVAQSFDLECSAQDISPETCEEMVAQPKSAILQFNRQMGRFGEVLSTPPVLSPWGPSQATPTLPALLDVAEALVTTEQALRIDLGRASRFHFMQQGENAWLVGCSLSHGALVYSWRFDESKITNVVSVLLVPALNGWHVVAAARGNEGARRHGGALAVLELGSHFDDLGKQTRSCRGPRCLRLVQELFGSRGDDHGQEALQLSPGSANELHWFAQQGLQGAASISFAHSCDGRGDCLVQVSHHSTRNELPCSRFPLPVVNPAPDTADETMWEAARCQRLSFQVTLMENSSDAGLLHGLPSIDQTGALSFQLLPKKSGTTYFRVVLVDNGAYWQESMSKVLQLNVLPVNEPPTFHLVPPQLIFIYQDGGMQSVIFARNVSGPEAAQGLQWLFVHSPRDLVEEPPKLVVHVEDTGEQVGVLTVAPTAGKTGAVSFSIILEDDGAHDAARGDGNRSAEEVFSLEIRGVNHAPIFSFSSAWQLTSERDTSSVQSNATAYPQAQSCVGPDCWAHGTCSDALCLTTVENADNTTVWPFVEVGSLGGDEEAEQRFSFSVSSFVMLQGSWPIHDFFDWIYVDHKDGALHLRTSNDRNGVVQIEIEMADDGGTLGGGTDRSRRNLTLTVHARNSHPRFSFTSAGVTLACTTSDTWVVLPDVIQRHSFPVDEREQNATFQVVYMSDPSLFASVAAPVRVDAFGTLSILCNPEASGVATVDVVLADDGLAGSAAAGAGAGAEQHLVCLSTLAAAPFCEVLFTGLAPLPHNLRERAYTGFLVSVSVANTDFDGDDEYVSAVYIGDLKLTGEPSSGRRFRSSRLSNRCERFDKIVDMWLPSDFAAFEAAAGGGVSGAPDQTDPTNTSAHVLPPSRQLPVRIETSEAVGQGGSCHGASLYAIITLTPYRVPDNLSVRQSLEVWVLPAPRSVSLRVPRVLYLVEQAKGTTTARYALVQIRDFVDHQESGVALADSESWTYSVSLESIKNPRLLVAQPILNATEASSQAPGSSNTLWLHLGWDEIGSLDLVVTASVLVAGGSQLAPQLRHTLTAYKCSVNVRPRPRVMRLQPCVGPVFGGTLVTMHGYHLAPLSQDDVLTITFGGRPCTNVSSLSSLLVTCITPPELPVWDSSSAAIRQADERQHTATAGAGAVHVRITLTGTAAGDRQERFVFDELRHATVENGFRYALLFVASISHLSAFSPAPAVGTNGKRSKAESGHETEYLADQTTTVWETGLETKGSISALALWQHKVIVAGSFREAAFAGAAAPAATRSNVHNLLAWDGSQPEPLGLGVAGKVHTLAVIADVLVVGGCLMRALQTAESPWLDAGMKHARVSINLVLALVKYCSRISLQGLCAC
jgi:hypothetical protein